MWTHQLWHMGSIALQHVESSPDQGWNPCPLRWQINSQPLHHQGSSKVQPFKKKFFFNLFLVTLGLCCCTWAFSSVVSGGFVIAVASLVAEHGLQQLQHVGSGVVARGLNSCGTQAQLLQGTSDSWTRDGTRVPSPVGGFLTTGPPGKTRKFSLQKIIVLYLYTNPCPKVPLEAFLRKKVYHCLFCSFWIA